MKEVILGKQLGINESFNHPQFNNTGDSDNLPPPPPILPHLSEDASSTSGLPLPSPPLCVTETLRSNHHMLSRRSPTHHRCVTLESPHIPSMVPPSSDQQVTLIEKDPGPIDTKCHTLKMYTKGVHLHFMTTDVKIIKSLQKSQNQNNIKRVQRTHLYLLTKIRTLAEQFPQCLTQ